MTDAGEQEVRSRRRSAGHHRPRPGGLLAPPIGLPATGVGVLAVFLLVLPAAGQLAPEDATSADPGPVLERLEAGQRLRVHVLDSGRREGRWDGLDGDRLRLRNGARLEIPLNRIEAIWTRGSRVKLGAIVGGGVGALIPRWRQRWP